MYDIYKTIREGSGLYLALSGLGFERKDVNENTRKTISPHIQNE